MNSFLFQANQNNSDENLLQIDQFIDINKEMSKVGASLRLGSEKNKNIPPLNHRGFLSLELNGKTFSPENLSESICRRGQQLNDYSPRFDYEGRKFRVRSPSSFVKSAQNWKNMPYQRIKNVDKAIQITKRKQNISMPDNGYKILPQFNHFSPSTSPKTSQKQNRYDNKIRMNNRTQYRTSRGWFGQNEHQHQLRRSIDDNRQNRNLIRLRQGVKNSHPKHIIQKRCQGDSDQRYFFPKQSERKIQRKQDMYMRNKSTLYAYIMRNRKKLSDKRQKKKSSIDYSLLQRLDYLQEQHQSELQGSGLKISLKRVVMFSGYKQK